MTLRFNRLISLLVCFSLLVNITAATVLPVQAQANKPRSVPATPVRQTAPARQAKTVSKSAASPCSGRSIYLPIISGNNKGDVAASSGVTTTKPATNTVSAAKVSANSSLCGRILDANEAENGKTVPVVGATVIHLESGIAVQTDKDGYFLLASIPAGNQHFEFNGAKATPTNTYGAYRSEKLIVADTVNEITRPIYIMKLDKAGETQVNPNNTTIVQNPNLNAQLAISAHTVKDGSGGDYTGPISLSKVPARFTPGSLPDSLVPGLVMTIQPMGLTFAQPAPVTFKNFDNLPPGTEVNLWSMDHKTSKFFIAGRGRVTADGKLIETIEGGIRESSWHFPMPAAAGLNITYDNIQDYAPYLYQSGPQICPINSAVKPMGSTVHLASGCMSTSIELPSYTSLGEAHGLDFIYSSDRAYPQPIISFNATLPLRAAVPQNGISYELLRFGDKTGSTATYIDTSTFNENLDEPFRGAIAVDGNGLTTSIQPYQIRLTSHYVSSSVSADINGRKIVVNEQKSPFGAGWGLAGLQRVYPQPNNRLLLVNGDGNALIFDPNTQTKIGGFTTVRGGSYGFQSGSNYVSARSALAQNFSGISYTEFAEITPDAFKDVDLVILGPAKENTQPIQPLSSTEKDALFNFVKTGHCAILFSEHINFAPDASRSLVSPFGLEFTGQAADFLQVTIPDPNASIITNGPFGQVFTLSQSRPGGFTKLGSYAKSLAINQFGAVLAVIDPNVIAPGSGGVVLFSDGNMFDEIGGLFQSNKTLFLNTISFCMADKQNAAALYKGPSGDFSTISKDTAGNFVRHLADGTEYRFDANGLETAMVDRNGNTTAYAYDAQNHLITITDPTGLVTTFAYSGNQLHTVTDPADRVTTYEYDAAGNLTKATFPDGSIQSFGYDSHHLLTTETDRRGSTRTHIYDAWGHLTSVTLPGDIKRSVNYIQSIGLLNPASGLGTPDKPAPVTRPADAVGTLVDGEGRKTLYQVGLVSYLSEITDPAGFVTSITRDSDGNPLNTKFPNGGIYDGSYDSKGNLLVATDRTVNGTTKLTYESVFNQVTSVTDPFGKVATFQYDAAGNLTQAQTPLGRVINLTYGNHGLPITMVDPLGTQTGFAYNSNGNLTQVVSGMGGDARTTSMLYTPQGYVQQLTDPLGRLYGFAYDTLGRTTAETLPGNRAIVYTYDADGNLISVTPPGHPAHTFSYDELGQLTAYMPPALAGLANTGTTYAYNKAQQLTSVIRPDGLTTTYTYDSEGRLNLLTQPRGATIFAYSPTTGQLQTINTPDGVNLTYGYVNDYLTKVTWSGPVAGTVSYHYDSKSRIDSDAVGDSVVNYVYDADDSLIKAGSMTFSYHPGSGLLTGSALGSVNDAWSYNAFAEPLSYSANFGNTPLYQATYTRDSLGRILTKNETIGGVVAGYAYAYDDADRLVEVKKDNAVVESYTYDANGNRLSTTRQGSTSNSTYDDQDRLINSGSTVYTYTANGELQSKTGNGQTTTYNYDVMGNLMAVTLPDGTQITYLVDGRNRRVGKKVNGTLVQGFLYENQLAPIAELDGNNQIISRFVYGSHPNVPDYMGKGGVLYRLITDHLGSVRLVVNVQTGAVVQRMDYDAFGQVLQDTAPGFQPFGFAGGLYDAQIGLVRFGARDYDAGVGRWTTKDPIGFAGGDGNLYGYVKANPLNLTDRRGLVVESALLEPAAPMLARSIPLVIEGCISSPVGWAICGGVVVGAGCAAIYNHINSTSIPETPVTASPKGGQCPPCPIPPPGESRTDMVPPSKPHWPCPGDHTHVYEYEYNQNPVTCQCHLKKVEVNVICH